MLLKYKYDDQFIYLRDKNNITRGIYTSRFSVSIQNGGNHGYMKYNKYRYYFVNGRKNGYSYESFLLDNKEIPL